MAGSFQPADSGILIRDIAAAPAALLLVVTSQRRWLLSALLSTIFDTIRKAPASHRAPEIMYHAEADAHSRRAIAPSTLIVPSW